MDAFENIVAPRTPAFSKMDSDYSNFSLFGLHIWGKKKVDPDFQESTSTTAKPFATGLGGGFGAGTLDTTHNTSTSTGSSSSVTSLSSLYDKGGYNNIGTYSGTNSGVGLNYDQFQKNTSGNSNALTNALNSLFTTPSLKMNITPFNPTIGKLSTGATPTTSADAGAEVNKKIDDLMQLIKDGKGADKSNTAPGITNEQLLAALKAAQEKPDKKNNMLLYIALGVVAVTLIVVGVASRSKPAAAAVAPAAK